MLHALFVKILPVPPAGKNVNLVVLSVVLQQILAPCKAQTCQPPLLLADAAPLETNPAGKPVQAGVLAFPTEGN